MEYSETALQKVREDRLLIDQVDDWLYEEIAPFLGWRILEIGCGSGNFARHMTHRELYIGIDIAADSVAQVERTYANQPNMQVFVADVTNEAFLEFAQYDIDTIFSLNVYEHIEDDVRALRHVHSVLQPGGRLILVVPAHDWLYGTIDRAIGHYRRYSKKSTVNVITDVGFKMIEQKYINAVGAIGWFVSGRILRNETPPADQLRLFNRVVPVLKRVEQSVAMPFGISLLSVAEKI